MLITISGYFITTCSNSTNVYKKHLKQNTFLVLCCHFKVITFNNKKIN